MWIFVIVTSLLVPSGKVLLHFLNFSVTQGALFDGIQKALTLSAVSALSQCTACVRFEGNGLLSLSFKYYGKLLTAFRNSKGTILFRLKSALGVFQENI